jgi:hypothetical protein
VESRSLDLTIISYQYYYLVVLLLPAITGISTSHEQVPTLQVTGWLETVFPTPSSNCESRFPQGMAKPSAFMCFSLQK